MILRLIPVIFSFLILTAHFSRINILPLTILCILLIALLFWRKKWVPRLIQISLIIGAAEWIRIAFVYIDQRKVAGEDWQRLAIILGGVALFTLLSGLMFETKILKKKYFMLNAD